MKKTLVLLLISLFIIPSVLALNLDIEKQSKNEVRVNEISGPVVFNLKITNLGEEANIEFYNLVGFKMFPVGTTNFKAGESKDIELKISPIGKFTHQGAYTFEYFIRDQDNAEIKKELTFNVVDLKDVFKIGSGEIDPKSNSIEIFIENTVNFDFKEVSAEFSSKFFNFKEEFSIGANEKQTFTVEINKEDFKELMAGFYTLNADISVENQKANVEGIIKFTEENIVTTSKRDYGLIISTKIIEKTNEGNVFSTTETVVKKNIISRLFTSFSPEPDIVERDGLNIYYTWSNEIKPGETLKIRVKTNWVLPLIVILFIIAIVILAKQYSKTNLVLRKKVSFVKTKGGEFALKVSIFVNSKHYIERVNVIDRLPSLTKLHERFGTEKPSNVDEKNRKIEWYFEKLEAGEVRMISYIIYSKIGVLGRFALPIATAIYEKAGKIHETISNRTFFVAEQRSKDLTEEEV